MVQVTPGAESWSAHGGDRGALVLHGFTGNPISMRPVAEALADGGFAVELPRLPGHGTNEADCNRTRWGDWAREASAALDLLTARTARRLVVGLSMGGLLALHLAGVQPERLHGVAVINPAMTTRDPRLRVLPILKWLKPTLSLDLGDDIARAGVSEHAYPRFPLRAFASMLDLQQRVQLSAVTQPVLVLTSAQDRIVDPSDSDHVLAGVASRDREQVMLRRSYHVATLDHDADLVTERVVDFAKRVGDG